MDFWYSKKSDNIDKIYSVEKIFRRTKVAEKSLKLVKKYNELAIESLNKINISEEKKRPFIDLANYLLKREK